jgi:hypothetical protein
MTVAGAIITCFLCLEHKMTSTLASARKFNDSAKRISPTPNYNSGGFPLATDPIYSIKLMGFSFSKILSPRRIVISISTVFVQEFSDSFTVPWSILIVLREETGSQMVCFG